MYRLGQLLFALVSENSLLLASLARVLKNLSTPLVEDSKKKKIAIPQFKSV
jgi:hypothetical protein